MLLDFITSSVPTSCYFLVIACLSVTAYACAQPRNLSGSKQAIGIIRIHEQSGNFYYVVWERSEDISNDWNSSCTNHKVTCLGNIKYRLLYIEGSTLEPS